MTLTLTTRYLLGPGPTNPYPGATVGLSAPLLGHLDPEFIRLMDETCDMPRAVWQTQSSRTLPLSATGSAGMDAALVNTAGEGDAAVVAPNGPFGPRMCAGARPCGAEVVRVDPRWARTSEP